MHSVERLSHRTIEIDRWHVPGFAASILEDDFDDVEALYEFDIDLLVAAPEGVLAEDEALIEADVDAAMINCDDGGLWLGGMDEGAKEPKWREFFTEGVLLDRLLIAFFAKPEPLRELGLLVYVQHGDAAALDWFDSNVESSERVFDLRG